MVWIKKFKNDIRDYIVQEKQIEVGDIEIPSYLETQQDYNLSQKYEIILMQYTDDMTGKQSYFWYDEHKQAVQEYQINKRAKNYQSAPPSQ